MKLQKIAVSSHERCRTPNVKSRICGHRPTFIREALSKNTMEFRGLPPDTAKSALAFVQKRGHFQNDKQLIKKAGVTVE